MSLTGSKQDKKLPLLPFFKFVVDTSNITTIEVVLYQHSLPLQQLSSSVAKQSGYYLLIFILYLLMYFNTTIIVVFDLPVLNPLINRPSWSAIISDCMKPIKTSGTFVYNKYCIYGGTYNVILIKCLIFSYSK